MIDFLLALLCIGGSMLLGYISIPSLDRRWHVLCFGVIAVGFLYWLPAWRTVGCVEAAVIGMLLRVVNDEMKGWF